MPIVLILLVLGFVFIYGGIKGDSISNLLLGSIIPNANPSPTSVGVGGGTALDSNPPGSPVIGTSQFSIISAASQFLGVPYKYGGNDPKIGIDCSRFVQLVYSDVGISLPRTTYAQFQLGQPVNLPDIQPGDVIFTEPSPLGPGHEGLYVGNNQVQESPHTGESNKIVPLSSFLHGGLVGIRRYL